LANIDIFLLDFIADVVSAEVAGGHECRTAPCKRVKDYLIGLCGEFNKGLHEADGFLRRVQTALTLGEATVEHVIRAGNIAKKGFLIVRPYAMIKGVVCDGSADLVRLRKPKNWLKKMGGDSLPASLPTHEKKPHPRVGRRRR
jgi:hypothetical protein